MEPVSRWKRGAFTAAPGELAEDAPADVVEGGVALLFGGQQSLHQLAALGRVVAPEAWRHPTRKNPPRKKKNSVKKQKKNSKKRTKRRRTTRRDTFALALNLVAVVGALRRRLRHLQLEALLVGTHKIHLRPQTKTR